MYDCLFVCVKEWDGGGGGGFVSCIFPRCLNLNKSTWKYPPYRDHTAISSPGRNLFRYIIT